MITVPSKGLLTNPRTPDAFETLLRAARHMREAAAFLGNEEGARGPDGRPCHVNTRQDDKGLTINAEDAGGDRHFFDLCLTTTMPIVVGPSNGPEVADMLVGSATLIESVCEESEEDAVALSERRSSFALAAARIAMACGLKLNRGDRVGFPDALAPRQPRPTVGGDLLVRHFADQDTADAIFEGLTPLALVSYVVVGDHRKPVIVISSETRSYAQSHIGGPMDVAAAVRSRPGLRFDPRHFPETNR